MPPIRCPIFNLSNGTSTINTPIANLTLSNATATWINLISGLSLSNSSTATTTAVGNVTSGVGISSKSKLTLGADMTLSGNMDVRDTDSILDMAGHTLHANQFLFGWYGGSPTLENRVPFTVNNLYVANKTFDLYASDTVSNFNLSNATSTINTPLSGLSLSNSSTATTTAVGNVTSSVGIYSKSKLTLGVDMTLSGNMDVRDTDSILDMAGHTLHANQFLFGWYGGSPTLENRVPFTVNNLYVANKTFDLYASDTVSNFNLSNATSTINTPLSGLSLSNSSTATTTAVGNVTSGVGISSKSKLTLGADMTLSGNMDVRDTDSILDMAGHTLHANQFLFGWYGGKPTLLNKGTLTANSLYVGSGNTLTLSPADLINNSINISNASKLTVLQQNDQLTGLTFNGTSQGNLILNDTSKMNLEFGSARFSRWIFRWRDPNSSSNWHDALAGLISAGKITITPSNGYYIADSGGYTYIYAVAQPADFDWQGGNASEPTDWNLAANWNPSTAVPDGAGVTLSFGNQTTGDLVDMGSGKTVGNLIFVATTNTTIQGMDGSSLILDNNGSISTVDVTGYHTITVPVIMNNDVQIAGIGSLTLSAGISGHYTLNVLGNLTASSIQVDTLSIGESSSGSSVAAVPEPATIVLLGFFAVGLCCAAWRQRVFRSNRRPLEV